MSSAAITMMIIGCGLLWGGFIFSISFYFHANKKRAEQEEKHAS
ncbi:MetS family NSS transporter small subunit [Hornefia porci]|nr:MetS family NSS transporter small subunit [Hornefia porci]